MITIERYTSERHDEWNAFVSKSKNGTFLFDRRYMDYHADCFVDYSLMFYDDKHRFFLPMPRVMFCSRIMVSPMEVLWWEMRFAL